MKRLILLLLFIPLVSCDFNLNKTDSNSVNEFDAVLRITAEKINKMCPMMIDKYTRMDNVAVLSNKKILHNYTLINDVVGDYTDEYLENEFASILINKVKTNPGLSLWRENNITLVYHYSDKNGITIEQYTITPEMYKQ